MVVLVLFVLLTVIVPFIWSDIPPEIALTLQWVGTIACVLQSALCSGLTVGLTGINRLELEAKAAAGNRNAKEILKLREVPFLLPVTLLWANVIFNVALPLIVSGMFSAWTAFLFSTVVITHVGEIFPVAIVSRHPLSIGAFLAPAVKVYSRLLYPLVRVEARFFEWMLGPEEIPLYSERAIDYMLARHVQDESSQIGQVEGVGARNFLRFDDILVNQEGESVVPESIIPIDLVEGKPQIPTDEEFVSRVFAPRKKWVILTDRKTGEPVFLLDARDFVNEVLLNPGGVRPEAFCHAPLIVRDSNENLGSLLPRLRVSPEHTEDDVIDRDVILVWNHERRLITGSDILGRLLRDIVRRESIK